MNKLKLFTYISTIVFLVSCINLYHHQTDDYFIQFFNYLFSIRIAFPPILFLLFSYSFFFFGGVQLSESPQFVYNFLRKQVLEKERNMILISLSFLFMSLFSFIYTYKVTPPSYERLVNILLGAENDYHVLIDKEMKLIKEKNLDFYNNMRIVVDVFKERKKRNYSNKISNTTIPRIFVRALESNINDKNWENHPLRIFALAEAYSMWAQSEKNSFFKNRKNWKKIQEKSLELYKKIQENNILSTFNMKNSAINNLGNLMYYTGDLNKAKEYYLKIIESNNLSTVTSLLATYITLGEYKNALDLGEKIRNWGMDSGKALIETVSYSGVLGNTGFLYLMQGENQKAVNLMSEAYDMNPDNMNTLNFSMSLIINKEKKLAKEILSTFRYPSLELSEQKNRVKEKYNDCFYFVNSFLFNENDWTSISANYYTFMKKAKNKNELLEINKDTFIKVKEELYNYMGNHISPCNDFLYIPWIKEKLKSGKF